MVLLNGQPIDLPNRSMFSFPLGAWKPLEGIHWWPLGRLSYGWLVLGLTWVVIFGLESQSNWKGSFQRAVCELLQVQREKQVTMTRWRRGFLVWRVSGSLRHWLICSLHQQATSKHAGAWWSPPFAWASSAPYLPWWGWSAPESEAATEARPRLPAWPVWTSSWAVSQVWWSHVEAQGSESSDWSAPQASARSPPAPCTLTGSPPSFLTRGL